VNEFLAYLQEPKVHVPMPQLLAYWAAQQQRFPQLFQLSLRYDCIQVSAAAIERVWSVVDRITSSDRTALSKETFNKLLSIQINQKHSKKRKISNLSD